MNHKGQIVEIPSSSKIFLIDTEDVDSKKDELLRNSPKQYSLFDGFLVGGHQGIEHFKLGQRKGINVGGKKAPLYVIGIDVRENRVFVGEGKSHPGLWTKVLLWKKDQFQWDFSTVENLDFENGLKVQVSQNEHQDLHQAHLYIFEEDVFLEFENLVSIELLNDAFQLQYHNEKLAEHLII